LDALITAQWTADAGDIKSALETVRRELKRREGQVRPQAILVDLLGEIKNTTKPKNSSRHYENSRAMPISIRRY